MMKRYFLLVVTSILLTSSLQAQQPLPIQRIALYKNGMAYVVRGGTIDAPTSLSFHPDEMNDVLKTFTAWNPENGQLYSLGYTTGIPTGQLLGRFPFDLRNPAGGLAQFLPQVKGAGIRIEREGAGVAGKLLGISPQKKKLVDESFLEDFRVSVLEDSGAVRTVWLSEVTSLRLTDIQLQEQLDSYLQILADGSQDVTKEISIYPGTSAGRIRASYLQQFPVWKTSYRLQFDDEKANLQGWALIDNPTGEEWSDVELTLISGMPVSFEMDLYQPLYTNRTRVPVPGIDIASPRFYESAVASKKENEQARDEIRRQRTGPGRASSALAQRPAAAPMNSRAIAGLASLEEAPAADIAPAQVTRIQDYFEYRFPFPVRLAARQSAFLPFMQKEVKAERLSIYNEQNDRNHPLNGARLTNDSGIPLEAGPATIFEQGRYAGEAVLEYTPRDDERLLSYGVDYEIGVVTDRSYRPEAIAQVSIRRGIATVVRERVQTTEYLLKNKSDRSKSVLIEHPRQAGRQLKGIEADETTQSFYRFEVDLVSGEEKKLPIQETLSRRTTLTISNTEWERIQVFFSGWTIPAALKEQLEQIVNARESLAAAQQRFASLNKELQSIDADQGRLRENLKALGESNTEQPLRQRYVRQLTQQEEQLDTLKAQLRDSSREVQRRQRELADLVANLNWREEG